MPAPPRTINAHDLRKGDTLARGGKVLEVFVYVIIEELGGRRAVTFQPKAKVLVKP